MGYEVGQQVADYEVVSILGTGGMGCVYRVCNRISQRTEAMKVLLADLSAEPDLAARFRGEIRTLAGLDHPNIAQLRTALQIGNELVMVMEFVEGCTLHQLAYQAPLSQEQIVGYIQQVLAALSFAHECGVVHRDIKPANIMVTPQGMVKLTDFGIAKSRRKDDLTRPGTTLGSLNYMSPEQALGDIRVDERSDLYSVGITLYELLGGKRPFEDESAYVVLQRQMNEVPQPPIEINPLLSQGLNDLIMKSLEKDPRLRFQTAREFSEALQRATGQVSTIPMVSDASSISARPSAMAGDGPKLLTTSIDNVPVAVKGRSPWSVGAVAAIVLVAATAAGVPLFLKSGVLVTGTLPSIVVAPLAPTGLADTVAAMSPLSVTATVTEPAPVEPSAATPVAAVVRLEAKIESVAHALSLRTHKNGRPALRSAGYSKDDNDSAARDADLPKDEVVTPPVLSPATIAAVQAISKQKDALDARAGVLRARVTRLRSEKAVEGRPLKQEIADAYVNMNENLGAGNTDLEYGDVSAAQSHMQKAAYEMSLLEKNLSQ